MAPSVSQPTLRSFSRSSSSSSSSSLTASAVDLSFGSGFQNDSVGENYDSTVVIGRKASIEIALPALLSNLGLDSTPKAVVNSMIESLDGKKGGSSTTLVPLGSNDDSTVHKLSVASLPTELSRNNHPMAVHTLTKLAESNTKGRTRMVVLNDDFAVAPLASAIAKAFPLFSLKTSSSSSSKEQSVEVVFAKNDGSLIGDNGPLKAASAVSTNVRLAARFMDMHPELLTTTAFAKEVETIVAKEFPDKVKITQIVGDELRNKGYGGLYNVGKAANCPPRMVILEYNGAGDASDETVALVGKGIVFDTGGLSLKVRSFKFLQSSRRVYIPQKQDV